MDIRAVQDRGCLSAAKFLYHFPDAIPRGVVAGFTDCEVVVREFSKTVPLAKDLVNIKSHGEFHAAFVIGGNRAVVYFDGSAEDPPREAMAAFDRRLQAAGCDRIAHVHDAHGASPGCDACPAGRIKGCDGVRRRHPLPQPTAVHCFASTR